MSLCPHGYTAFWDCPDCEEPMGTRPVEPPHEMGCSWHIGQRCTCETIRKVRAAHERSRGVGETAGEPQ